MQSHWLPISVIEAIRHADSCNAAVQQCPVVPVTAQYNTHCTSLVLQKYSAVLRNLLV